MYLIVGLGNPGEKYQNTRHNVGFVCVDEISKRTGDSPKAFKDNNKLNSQILKTKIGDSDAILIKPTTYMNLSGEAVAAVAKYYKIDPEQIIVISDDSNLSVGQARIRFTGEAGGHNGLKSLIEHLGEEFWRVRVGIGQEPGIALEDFVLGKIKPDEAKIIDETIDKTIDLLVKSISDNTLENETIN
jgi:PTH1 family peptidyl-tRNA hydrolase